MPKRELGELEAAVKADPRHRRALYRLATALLERNSQIRRVLDIATRLHHADPDNPLYAGLLGAACQLSGKPRRARSLLTRALAPDPLLGSEATAPFRYYLAVNLVASGDTDGAAAQLESLLASKPRGPVADRARKLLARLKGATRN